MAFPKRFAFALISLLIAPFLVVADLAAADDLADSIKLRLIPRLSYSDLVFSAKIVEVLPLYAGATEREVSVEFTRDIRGDSGREAGQILWLWLSGPALDGESAFEGRPGVGECSEAFRNDMVGRPGDEVLVFAWDEGDDFLGWDFIVSQPLLAASPSALSQLEYLLGDCKDPFPVASGPIPDVVVERIADEPVVGFTRSGEAPIYYWFPYEDGRNVDRVAISPDGSRAIIETSIDSYDSQVFVVGTLRTCPWVTLAGEQAATLVGEAFGWAPQGDPRSAIWLDDYRIAFLTGWLDENYEVVNTFDIESGIAVAYGAESPPGGLRCVGGVLGYEGEAGVHLIEAEPCRNGNNGANQP